MTEFPTEQPEDDDDKKVNTSAPKDLDNKTLFPFPLDEALASSEKKIPLELIEFTYEFRNKLGEEKKEQFKFFSQTISPVPPPQTEGEVTTQFREMKKSASKPAEEFQITLHVKNNNDEMVGLLSGRVFFRGEHFVNFVAENETYYDPKLPRIPGLILESIAQLLIQGVFVMWHSSPQLTKGGENLLNALETDSRLDSKTGPDYFYDGEERQMVTVKAKKAE